MLSSVVRRSRGLRGPAIDHVSGAVQKLVYVELQPRVFEDADPTVLVEIHQDVDITRSGGSATGDRPEERCVQYAKVQQVIFVIGGVASFITSLAEQRLALCDFARVHLQREVPILRLSNTEFDIADTRSVAPW
jgi:hypothetical protein